MRLLVWLVIGGLGFWVLTGAPVPVVGLQPMQPDPSLPTFKESVAQGNAVAAAVRRGEVKEDPELRAMRQNVLQAARRLEFSPCNEERRREAAAAVRVFLESAYANSNKPPKEVVHVNGRALDARTVFEEEVSRVVDEIMMSGAIKKNELPRFLRGGADPGMAAMRHGAYACDRDRQ